MSASPGNAKKNITISPLKDTYIITIEDHIRNYLYCEIIILLLVSTKRVKQKLSSTLESTVYLHQEITIIRVTSLVLLYHLLYQFWWWKNHESR